jgi:hypothetical protein
MKQKIRWLKIAYQFWLLVIEGKILSEDPKPDRGFNIKLTKTKKYGLPYFFALTKTFRLNPRST